MARLRYKRNPISRKIAQGPLVQDEVTGKWFREAYETRQFGYLRDSRDLDSYENRTDANALKKD